MTGQDWFQVRPIGPQTWAIDDHDSDVIYVAAGDEKALLIDTGWGVGELPALVASLTPLPLLVVNTHGHPDHTSGNGQFRKVHIHAADRHMVEAVPTVEQRRQMAAHLPGPLPPDFNVETWNTAGPKVLVSIRDGHVFDLGGRTLEVIELAGHSPGSICLLDREGRLLWTGDSIHSHGIWLQLEDSLPLHEFRDNLQRVQDMSAAFDVLLPAHGWRHLPVPKQTLADLIAGIERILCSEIVGREEHTFAGDGLRCDFGSCGILYRPDRL